MREYVCKLGHVFWWAGTALGRCVEGGCPAPAEWTGLQRGQALDDHRLWGSVWGQVRLDPDDASGCWLWQGSVGQYGPKWRRLWVRREVWLWMFDGLLPWSPRKWHCGEERCVRPSHSFRRVGSRRLP